MTHLKWCFFAKIVYSFKLLTFSAKSTILRSVTGAESALGIFSDLHLSQILFLILTFLSINGTTTLHTNVCLTTGIRQQCLSCRLDILVNFRQIFVLFLGTFIVDFEYYLFIVNFALWHIFEENKKGVIFMGVVATDQFPTVSMIKLFFKDICR